MTVLARAADALWLRLPAALGRQSPAIAAVLGDGGYLARWPPAALVVPGLAFVVGLALGGGRPQPDLLFTYSVVYPAMLLGFASFGAAIGLWAWLGFVVGDYALFPHVSYRPDPLDHAIREIFPLLITYELLFALLVLQPLAVSAMAGGALRPLRRVLPNESVRTWARVAIAAFVAAFTAATWSSSVQILIRPVATMQSTILDPRAVQPMRTDGWVLIAVAVAGAAARVLLAHQAGPVLAPSVARRPKPESRASLVWSVIIGVLVGVGLLGLLDQPEDVVYLFAATIGTAVLRLAIQVRLPSYAAAINRIPLLVRVLVVAVLGDLVGTVILQATSLDGSLLESFRPLLLTAAIAMLIAAILLPAAPRSTVARVPA